MPPPQGFATKTDECVFQCETGYHAALNKTSLRGTAERLAVKAVEQDPDRFELRSPVRGDKVYAAAKERGGTECKFQARALSHRSLAPSLLARARLFARSTAVARALIELVRSRSRRASTS